MDPDVSFLLVSSVFPPLLPPPSAPPPLSSRFSRRLQALLLGHSPLAPRSLQALEQQEQRLSADMQKVEAQVTPAHLPASRGTTPGSPATSITARVDDQLVGYRDLAALPRDKAILQVERPDLMTYQPHLTFSSHDPLPRERSLSPPASSPIMSPEVRARRAQSETDSVSPAGSTLTLQEKRRSQQHFHTPDNGANIYMKPPIYKQDVMKVSEGLTVIRSAMFPAAQPPDPNLPSKIETEYWPCPPSLATIEMEREGRRQKELQEDDEFEDLSGDAEMLREQELEKIKSNLGRLILKEEKEKAVQYRRKTQSLPDRTHMHTSLSAGATRSPSRGLTRMQSAEFASEKAQPEMELQSENRQSDRS
ncbi:hypothetical protein CgunFtcFv8_025228 [Champsocephalus gunnari]|uniref:Putative adherens-junction anchoring domain-containing protein n=1 Tax=Champsocephalus gunnari TaxID=52237 RepID=A0AAN8C9Y4_CHAGU|nr:hypothetical protein CgunFtcFv8_025228 [Champsocephalus gunnari]